MASRTEDLGKASSSSLNLPFVSLLNCHKLRSTSQTTECQLTHHGNLVRLFL